MPSVSLKSARCLLLVLLLTPASISFFGGVAFARGTPVSSKSLKIDDSQWTVTDGKQENGKFDNLVDKKTKKRVASASSSASSTTQADATGDTAAGGSTSEEGSGWVWAILASLLVVGGGLTCFGYYWSNMRRVASW